MGRCLFFFSDWHFLVNVQLVLTSLWPVPFRQHFRHSFCSCMPTNIVFLLIYSGHCVEIVIRSTLRRERLWPYIRQLTRPHNHQIKVYSVQRRIEWQFVLQWSWCYCLIVSQHDQIFQPSINLNGSKFQVWWMRTTSLMPSIHSLNHLNATPPTVSYLL